MAVSRPCEECHKTRPCCLYRREAREVADYRLSTALYLCRQCARALGYEQKGAAHA